MAKRHCGAAPVCYRAKSYCAAYARKGRPAFCGPPQNRDFSRKKRFSSLCARGKRNCLSAISTPRFLFMRSSPGWPASDFRVLSPRDIYGTFCLGSIWLNAGRPAPGMLSVNWQRPPKAGGRKAQGCGRERACSLAPKAQPVAPGEERVIHLSRPPDGGKKGVFGAFWGFGQKALRREEESTLCFPACRKTGWQIASCTNAA